MPKACQKKKTIQSDSASESIDSSDSSEEELQTYKYLPLPAVDDPSEIEDLDDETILNPKNRKGKRQRTARKQNPKRKKINNVKVKNVRYKTIKKKTSKKAKKKAGKSWINGDFEKTTKFKNYNDRFLKYRSLSPVELFELFFSDEVWKHMKTETTKYALHLNCPDPNINVADLKCFFGILILSGYNVLPGKKMYWYTGKDMGNRVVSNAMRRDRFIEIMRFMHWSDNTQASTSDKLWKIRPVIEMLQAGFLQHFVPTEFLNYDESMVKYYGRHALKQFIKGKPIRFGYKVWCLNTVDGYLVAFVIYQGKGPQSNPEYEKLFGKCTAPLIDLLDLLHEKELPYQIFTDNLFTSFNLLTNLRKRGYGVTGTMRKNRIPKDCPLPDKNEMIQNGRGAYDSIISKDDGIILVRWTDNSVVTVASTTYGVEPLSTAKRYSKSEKKHIDVPRPNLIEMYNKYMGGTDRMDQDLARHRISIRGKKWYWPLLTWLIDVAIQNAWALYKSSGRKIKNLDFRRNIANFYMNGYGNPPKRKGPPTCKKVPNELRFDRIDHFVEHTPLKVRRRCAYEKCKSSVRTQCKKCDRGLCIDCFIPFHSK